MRNTPRTKTTYTQAISILIVLFCAPAFLTAQTTKDPGNKTDPTVSTKKKVLIVPWDPKMFNCSSDISSAISKETSQKYSQIQEALRKGMVDQLKKSFSTNYTAVSLLDDTAKMNRDLRYVYNCTSMSYTSVNAPLNPTKADSVKMKQQAQPGIKNGEVVATSPEGEKFMNTIVLSPNLLGYLKAKYGADYVVFVNQVDLENDLGSDPLNLEGKTDYVRKAVAHWTIFETATGKRVAMGKTKGTFSASTNSPKKIIDSAFSSVAKAINEKLVAAVKP